MRAWSHRIAGPGAVPPGHSFATSGFPTTLPALPRSAAIPSSSSLVLRTCLRCTNTSRRSLTRFTISCSDADEHPRGLISLPTGAGKTRVAVQALVEALSRRGLGSPVVWIAPSDELCEQAVQTWSEVWRAYGSMEELRIGRLWGSNEVPESVGGSQVVVATTDKLRNRVGSDGVRLAFRGHVCGRRRGAHRDHARVHGGPGVARYQRERTHPDDPGPSSRPHGHALQRHERGADQAADHPLRRPAARPGIR